MSSASLPSRMSSRTLRIVQSVPLVSVAFLYTETLRSKKSTAKCIGDNLVQMWLLEIPPVLCCRRFRLCRDSPAWPFLHLSH